jgi:hypothetical protein
MNIEFLRAAFDGDLPRVQRMLADGEARIPDADRDGCIALLRAAKGFNLPTLKWLLGEGGARITERNHEGHSALLLAAGWGRMKTCQWFLEHGGADIAEGNDAGTNVWDKAGSIHPIHKCRGGDRPLASMVLKCAPPANFMILLKPEHRRVVEDGARILAAVPAYLARWRALLDPHCPLIAPLRDLVRSYDPGPTTTEELWATGLGAASQRARRPRVEAAVALPVRRSARLRQRLEW